MSISELVAPRLQRIRLEALSAEDRRAIVRRASTASMVQPSSSATSERACSALCGGLVYSKPSWPASAGLIWSRTLTTTSAFGDGGVMVIVTRARRRAIAVGVV